MYISVLKFTSKQNESKFLGLVKDLRNHLTTDLATYKNIFIVSEHMKIECSIAGKIVNKIEFMLFLGYYPEDIKSESIFDYCFIEDLEKLHVIFDTIKSGLDINYQIIRLVRKSKELMYLSWSSTILPSSTNYNDLHHHHHYVVIANDITEFVRTDNRLKILMRAINESPNAILLANVNGKIEYVNKCYCDALHET